MRVAAVQTTSTDDVDANLAFAGRAIAEAAARGAELVALPENFAFMRREGTGFPCAQGEDGAIVRFLREAAARHGVWLLGGSFPESIPGDARVYNTSALFAPDGSERARYRKIHLFDVDVGPDARDSFRESKSIAPGREVVTAKAPFGVIGLSICYDVRFPELYRRHADAGARFITVPSAFTPQTGKDHWEVLLRARAIEAQAFVIAPAQCGRHSADRASYGRSMIVDPWGLVLARAGDRPCVIDAECDLDDLERIRASVPALRHRRLS